MRVVVFIDSLREQKGNTTEEYLHNTKFLDLTC